MHVAPPLADEVTRLAALRQLSMLDTPPEERFDRFTRLAKRLFDVPLALISLVDEDRQWFKSCAGASLTQSPRDSSFCGHTIAADDIMLVPDTLQDPRFHDNPGVIGEPHVRFYAGCPLSVADGSRIGTLCVLDTRPRSFDEEELGLLRDLAHMAEQEFAIVQLAHIDELTQVSNRRGFQALAQRALDRCWRQRLPVSVLFFDLDGFKALNDRWGHAQGDRALATFAALLLSVFRDSDVVGRLGGDEFCVLLSNCAGTHTQSALGRLQTALEAHNQAVVHGQELRFSVGQVTTDMSRPCTVDSLLALADARMYEKKRGRAAL
jgi:diguanylate cyclase (GGDEF)-like protein